MLAEQQALLFCAVELFRPARPHMRQLGTRCEASASEESSKGHATVCGGAGGSVLSSVCNRWLLLAIGNVDLRVVRALPPGRRIYGFTTRRKFGIVLPPVLIERRDERRDVKILLVVSELPPVRSGVASSAELLSEHYRKKGHQLETITMRGLPKLVWGELRLSFFFLRWPSIRRELRNYDCVHLHGPAPTFSELFLVLLRLTMSGKSRPKVVYTHHFELDLPGVRLLCWLYNRMHAWMIRLADGVVVTTRAYERLLLDRGHEEVTVIPWGGGPPFLSGR